MSDKILIYGGQNINEEILTDMYIYNKDLNIYWEE
jgi:hypothetical protein